ncbi:MAG: divergent PAP2 family protein [Ruminococcaceae bacterium]|nr:divergent PAP2 family protein [Oscillospiraceae bacterium]
MGFFRLLLQNRILLAGVGAWLTAQVLKTIIHAIVHKSLDLSRLVGDGGMPSGHSATVSAVAAMCALQYGADSPIFAVSAILAIITCHDAMNARQEIGKQAVVLNQLIRDMFEGGDPETVLEEFVGHTPFQVCAGILLGILVACAMHFWL